MSKFKVGDKVRIKKDYKSGSEIIDGFIKQLLGKTTVITKVIDVDSTRFEAFKKLYVLDIDKGKWNWAGNMLEPVEEVEMGDEVRIREGIKRSCSNSGILALIDEMLEVKIGDTVEIIEDKLKGIKGEIIDILPHGREVKIGIEQADITIGLDYVRLISKAKQKGLYISQMNEECKYILDGDRTTIILPSGVKGQVKLYKGDKYDKDLGMDLAYHKAKFNEILKRNELKVLTL